MEIGFALAFVVVMVFAPIMLRGKPAGPAPGSYWYAETPDLRKTFGSLDWCQFELTLSRTHVSMRFDQDIALENADFGFVYNERVTGQKPGATAGAGYSPTLRSSLSWPTTRTSIAQFMSNCGRRRHCRLVPSRRSTEPSMKAVNDLTGS